nr:hypothetical protein [Tanacetum cinerariifolium]GEW84884.1 hypothetical protein [Tanacetum cinerariifolium]
MTSWHWPAAATCRLKGGQPSPTPLPEPSVNGGEPPVHHREPPPAHRSTTTEPPVNGVRNWSSRVESGVGSSLDPGRVATCHHLSGAT